MTVDNGSLWVLLAAFSIIVTLWFRVYVKHPHLYPPGPKGEWLLGNARQMPTTFQWLTFAKWSDMYGPYIFLWMLRTPYLIVNSGKVALDLLEHRSTIYSDRPYSVMATELIGWDFISTTMRYGATWRQHRKMLHQYLGKQNADNYRKVMIEETKRYLQTLASKPEGFLDATRRLSGSTIIRMAYGLELQEDDAYIAWSEEALDGLTQTFGTGFAVDVLPWMRYIPEWLLPSGGFHKLARQWRIPTRSILNSPWILMMKNYTQGTAEQSFCRDLLDENGGIRCDAETEDIIKRTSATLYAAGVDTTSAIISSFFLAMTLHPDIFRMAQAEVDGVVGKERLPLFEDRQRMPYIECVLKELYRWNPASPFAVAHRLTQDDVYQGHYLPTGTVVIPNLWAMLHDPEVYPDPFTFNPNRYRIDSDIDFIQEDPRKFAFGFGRRICVGQYFADDTIWITLVSILACFDIQRKVLNGEEIVPQVNYPQFVGHPMPFECDITLRRNCPRVTSLQE